jgi:hypothetical protein
MLAPGTHKTRFAVRRKSSTDPDVATTAVMLSALHTAADSAIGKCPDALAVAFARPFLHFDCFLAAMMHPLGGRAITARPRRFPVEVDLRSCATVAARR